MDERDTRDPVKNEADNGIKNKKGTLSMARTPAPHSATSQFFINLADNANLDFRSQTPAGWGYAVFAEVVSGAEIVRQIAQAPTTTVVSAPRCAAKAGRHSRGANPSLIERGAEAKDGKRRKSVRRRKSGSHH